MCDDLTCHECGDEDCGPSPVMLAVVIGLPLGLALWGLVLWVVARLWGAS